MYTIIRRVIAYGITAIVFCAAGSVKGQERINALLTSWFSWMNDTLSSAMQWMPVYVLFALLMLLCFGTLACHIWKRSWSAIRLMVWLYMGYILWDDNYWLWAKVPCADVPYNRFFALLFMLLALEEVAIMLFAFSDSIGKKGSIDDNGSLLFVDEDDSEDLLHFKEDAKLLVKYLNENAGHDSAVGVAVMGTWGTGKTRFLKYMSEALEELRITPVNFNPWINKTENPENALLKAISEAVGMSNETRELFDEYADELKVSNITGWASVIAIGCRKALKWLKGSHNGTKELLKEAMSKASMPIFVFIDDCDRLEFNAFKDILSLIRGTADLPNLIFVVAFDAERAQKMLKETGDDKFMQKMFNVPHVLTPVSNDIMRNYLIEKVNEMEIDLGEDNRLFSGIILTAYLPTFREAKRWLNMLYVDYQGFKGSRFKEQIIWQKWIMVELLKFCESYLYEQLKNSPERLLQKEEKEDLNDHVYSPKAEMMEGYPDHIKKLMGAIYKDADLRNPFDVSNQVCHELYYYVEPVQKMLTKDEFNQHDVDTDWKAIIDKHLKTDKYQNIPNLIADTCKDILPSYAYILMTAFLESVCDYPGSNFTEMADGSKISRYKVHAHAYPFLATLVWLASFNIHDIDEEERKKEEDRLEEFCKHPQYRHALIAILADAMVRFNEDELIDVGYYYKVILEGMLQEEKPDYTGLIWAIAYCPQRKLMEDFLKDFLDVYFTDCLPNLLTTINKDDKEMLIVRHNVMRALFDTYDNMGRVVKRWRMEGKYDQSLLKEFESLVVKTMCFTPARAKDLEKEHFPLLSQYKPVGSGLCMPLNAIKINKDFWGSESRFKEPANYYFAQDAN